MDLPDDDIIQKSPLEGRCIFECQKIYTSVGSTVMIWNTLDFPAIIIMRVCMAKAIIAEMNH